MASADADLPGLLEITPGHRAPANRETRWRNDETLLDPRHVERIEQGVRGVSVRGPSTSR
ncbi:hypothetical protein [Streptomyces sp. NPDC020965]|uniref:hypothetical protein n=1 Tax=Streptomyces sp. NPDC020965 TaxID=3365105 RepID=UPI0037A6964B